MVDQNPNMTNEEADQLQMLIHRAEMAYDEAPEISVTHWPYKKWDLSKAEEAEESIHGLVGDMLATRNAEIAALKAENARYRQALDDISTGHWNTTDDSIICMMDTAGAALHPIKSERV